jgi:hypothetical protein
MGRMNVLVLVMISADDLVAVVPLMIIALACRGGRDLRRLRRLGRRLWQSHHDKPQQQPCRQQASEAVRAA